MAEMQVLPKSQWWLNEDTVAVESISYPFSARHGTGCRTPKGRSKPDVAAAGNGGAAELPAELKAEAFGGVGCTSSGCLGCWWRRTAAEDDGEWWWQWPVVNAAGMEAGNGQNSGLVHSKRLSTFSEFSWAAGAMNGGDGRRRAEVATAGTEWRLNGGRLVAGLTEFGASLGFINGGSL